MATANKSTGLQIALVFTVMATIIALVVAFLQFRRANEMDGKFANANSERSKVDGDLHVATADLQTLKELLGWASTPEVGKLQAEGDATVVGQCKKVMAEVAPGDTAPTVEATLHRLGSDLDTVRQENSGLKSEKVRLSERITTLQSEYQKLVDAHDKARKDAEKDRNEAQASKEDSVKEKEKEIAEHQSKIQELQASVQQQGQEMAQREQQEATRQSGEDQRRPPHGKGDGRKTDLRGSQRNGPVGRYGHEARVDQSGRSGCAAQGDDV
jgi:uncharacterized protein (DUF3084 family)